MWKSIVGHDIKSKPTTGYDNEYQDWDTDPDFVVTMQRTTNHVFSSLCIQSLNSTLSPIEFIEHCERKRATLGF